MSQKPIKRKHFLLSAGAAVAGLIGLSGIRAAAVPTVADDRSADLEASGRVKPAARTVPASGDLVH